MSWFRRRERYYGSWAPSTRRVREVAVVPEDVLWCRSPHHGTVVVCYPPGGQCRWCVREDQRRAVTGGPAIEGVS